MMYDYYLGVDLGQASDYTALALLEEPVWMQPNWANYLRGYGAVAGDQALFLNTPSGWVSPADLLPAQLEMARRLNYQHGRPSKPPLSLRHLERLPLATSYPRVVEHVQRLLARPPLSHSDSTRAATASPKGIWSRAPRRCSSLGGLRSRPGCGRLRRSGPS